MSWIAFTTKSDVEHSDTSDILLSLALSLADRRMQRVASRFLAFLCVVCAFITRTSVDRNDQGSTVFFRRSHSTRKYDSVFLLVWVAGESDGLGKKKPDHLSMIGLCARLGSGLAVDGFSEQAALEEDVSSIGIVVVVEEVAHVTRILLCHDLDSFLDGIEVETFGF